jgi:mono/diheme cytochrome c family protein
MPAAMRLWLVVAVACGAGAPVGAASESEPAGLYSAAQAQRGERLYETNCAQCHGARLEGASAVPLSGAAFSQRWQEAGRTVDDLFYIVRTLMPYSQPGKLNKQEYLDVVVYVLKVNGYPAGERELPLDPALLKKLVLKPAQ